MHQTIQTFSRLLQQMTRTRLPVRRTRRPHAVSAESLEVRLLLTADLDFAVSMGGTLDEIGRGIAVDAGGNVYTTGYFFGTADFDPGAGASSLTASGQPSDVFISKLDQAGNFVWAKQIGGPQSDRGEKIALDGAGNVYVTGTFAGTIDADPGVEVSNLIGAGGADAFVVKLNSSGDFVWAKGFGGLDEDFARDIAIDAAGNVVVTGDYRGTIDLDPGAGVLNMMSAGDYDAYVVQLSSVGDLNWGRSAGGTFNDIGLGLALDSASNVIVTGRYNGPATFDAVSSVVLEGAGAFVMKLETGGNFVWARALSSTNLADGYSVATDSDDNIVTVGTFFGTIDLDPSVGIANRTSNGGSDMFVAKLDSAGGLLWGTSLGGLGFDAIYGVAVDASNGIYLTGGFDGLVDFDPSAGAFSLSSAGGTDAFVTKLDASGTLEWARRFGGTGADFVLDMVLDNTGSILTTGYYERTVDFDPGSAVTTLTSVGFSDIVVSKLSPDFLFTLGNGLKGDLLLKKKGPWLELYFAPTGGSYSLQERHRLSEIRAVRIKENSNSNSLTLDYSAGGNFTVPGGVIFTGVGNNVDTVRLIGVGNEGFTYAPSVLTPGSGKFLTYGGEVAFSGAAQVFVSGTQALAIETQGSNDVVAVSGATGFRGDIAARISGTSNSAAFPAITFDNVRDLTIDTGAKDKLVAQSIDTVTFFSGSYEAQGLRNVFVRTGKGNDTLTVNGPDIGLATADARFWFLGGSGIDRLISIGDTNWDLNDSRLVSGAGGRISIDEIEKATVTGGASRNFLNAAFFSGDASLDGGANNDVLRGGSGNDILAGGVGNDRLFGGGGDDILYGQDGNDQIWGEAGEDALYGSTGNDQMWGGDDNDFMSGDAGNDVLQGGNGDDTLNGAADNDRLYGDAGNDILNGGDGNDLLSGGDDNDAYIGGLGVDLYDLQGTGNAEDLALLRASATSASFRRKPRGLTSVLELDTITMDASDEFLISTLGGDDLIAIDLAFTQLGSVDGGDGTDACTNPAAWTRVSC